MGAYPEQSSSAYFVYVVLCLPQKKPGSYPLEVIKSPLVGEERRGDWQRLYG